MIRTLMTARVPLVSMVQPVLMAFRTTLANAFLDSLVETVRLRSESARVTPAKTGDVLISSTNTLVYATRVGLEKIVTRTPTTVARILVLMAATALTA